MRYHSDKYKLVFDKLFIGDKSALDDLIKIIEDKRVFQRNKRCVQMKAKAFLLYQNGYSYEGTADQLGIDTGERPSKSNVYYWVKRIGEALKTNHQ